MQRCFIAFNPAHVQFHSKQQSRLLHKIISQGCPLGSGPLSPHGQMNKLKLLQEVAVIPLGLLLWPHTICFLWPCELHAGHSEVFNREEGLDVQLRVKTCGFHHSGSLAACTFCSQLAAAWVVSEADGWRWW